MTREEFEDLKAKYDLSDSDGSPVRPLKDDLINLFDIIENGFEDEDDVIDYCICDELMYQNAYLDGKVDALESALKLFKDCISCDNTED